VCECARARERKRIRGRESEGERGTAECVYTPAYTHARRRHGVYDACGEKRMGHLQDQPQPALVRVLQSASLSQKGESPIKMEGRREDAGRSSARIHHRFIIVAYLALHYRYSFVVCISEQWYRR